MGNTIYKYSERLKNPMYPEIDRITRQCIAMHNNPNAKCVGNHSFILNNLQSTDRVMWFYDYDDWFAPDSDYAKDISNKVDIETIKYVYRDSTNAIGIHDNNDTNKCSNCNLANKLSTIAKDINEVYGDRAYNELPHALYLLLNELEDIVKGDK